MIEYLLIFYITFIFTLIAENNLNKKRKGLFYFFSVIAIIIPSIMAGVRASGVGTDTQVYIDKVFKYISNCNNIDEIIEYHSLTNLELLYLMFNFFISRISTSLSAIYFSLSFIINLLFYTTFVYFYKKEKISLCLTYIIFLLLFFNKSLNMTRQMLSMAICFWGVKYIFEKKLSRYIITIIIAALFHNSALIFLPVYYFKHICYEKNPKNKTIAMGIIIGILTMVLLLEPVLNKLIQLGILNIKYYNYIVKYGNNSNIKLIEWIPKILFLCILLFFNKELLNKSQINKFLIFLFFIECTTFLFGVNSMYAQRTSYYFEVFICLLIPQIMQLFAKNKDKILCMIIILFLCTSYSCLYYGKYQFDQTVPYIIDFNK